MTQAERTHRAAKSKLEKLSNSKDELWVQGESAKNDLSAFRKDAAQALIEGGDGEKVAAALATRESKAAMFAAALAEVATQITAQEAIVAETDKVVLAEASAEAARQIRTSALKMIKQMAALQVDLYRCLEMQRQSLSRFPILDFSIAAEKLEESQNILEHDAQIKQRSKVPSAGRIGGFVDDTRTVTSLGSQIRDWAREQATTT